MNIRDPLVGWYLVAGPAVVLASTVGCHLVGSTILAVVTGGPKAILAGPVLALFGWFFLPIEFLGVVVQWAWFAAGSFSVRTFKAILLVSTLLVPTLVAVLGPKEQLSEVQWALGYGLGTAAAGLCSLVALQTTVLVITFCLDRFGCRNDA